MLLHKDWRCLLVQQLLLIDSVVGTDIAPFWGEKQPVVVMY